MGKCHDARRWGKCEDSRGWDNVKMQGDGKM